MATETELLRLALAAYEAAAEPELWLDFLKRYTEILSAQGSVLQIHDIGGHVSTVLSGFGLASPLTKSYNEHYSKLNIWREHGRANIAAGRVNLSHEMCPREVLERSEFYNDYMLRIGGAYSMGAVFAREGNRAPTVSSQRSKRPFDERDREIAKFLLPHLSRAWIIAERLDQLAAGEAVLDTLPLGAVFLGEGGSLVYANQAAGEILRAGDGLSLRNGVLTAQDGRAETQLREAINSALSLCHPPGPAAVMAPRRSLGRSYQVVAAPLLGRLPQFNRMAKPMALVLITDPERQTPASTDLLRELYKLTPREAAFAAKLSQGKSVEQTAEEMCITYETARTHLRRIFSKTGASRQAELLLLIARLPVVKNGGSDG